MSADNAQTHKPEWQFAYAEGGVVAPAGFMAAGVSAGIKKTGKRDVCVVVADRAAPAAAVFTTNSMAAAPVLVSRAHVANGMARAIAVNSGNANACTGPQGMADARAMAAVTAAAIGCKPDEVLVASTGVIGVPMPADAVLAGIVDAADILDSSTSAADAAAEAIMTTDTFAKQVALSVDAHGTRYTVGGMAKGSGMIMPNMATMLAFVTTDAPLTPQACSEALHRAVEATFNRITVDSDTSTNDMCSLMASGNAGGDEIGPQSARFAPVAAAVLEVCGELARMIVRDGEGASKFISITVQGAASDADAHAAAMSIANSPLFKTAVFGGDANWGRVVMAVGKSSAKVDSDTIEVIFAGITVCKDGTGHLFDEKAAAVALANAEVDVVVDLHLGEGSATVWTCDLSHEYIRINGEYRT
jgi:glutamate N-acetyltransferase/amino-acid N-acetyltransferase